MIDKYPVSDKMIKNDWEEKNMEHRQVLLIGFGSMEEKLRELIEPLNLEVLSFGPSRLTETVGTLCMQREQDPREEAMERGLIMFHNIKRDDLDPVLKVLRQAGIPKQPLKAMVTPTNWHWKLKNLMEELQQEQEIMAEIMKLKKLRDSMPMPAFTDIPAMKARMAAEVQLSGGEQVTVETVRAAYRELQKFAK